MQSSICLEDVDEGGPNCRSASTNQDGQPPASEPPPVTANFTARVAAWVARKGVSWSASGAKWLASSCVHVSPTYLGSFDDEEDAARAVDAAVAKYKLSGRTLNFPGEVPLASVLAALPPAPRPAPPRRSGRAPAPKVIVDAPGPVLRCERDLPIDRHSLPRRKSVEGAYRNQNGTWTNATMFPGREFDDLDAYRAAKKQRKERRAAYSVQANRHDKRCN